MAGNLKTLNYLPVIKYFSSHIQYQYMQDYVDQKEIGNEVLIRLGQQQFCLLRRSIGALTFQTPQDEGKGTAVLISPNLILTCAHNIYDKVKKIEYKDFKFYLAVHGESDYYYQIETYRYLQEFKTCENRQKLKFEFALMKLKDNIERPINFSNFLKLDSLCPQCDKNKYKLSIYGYSSCSSYIYESIGSTSQNSEILELKIYQVGLTKQSRIQEINFQEYCIKYQITTHPGQSGCPVATNGTIIAIHVGGGARKHDFNIGRLITREMVEIMEGFVQQMKAEPFEVHQHCHQVKYDKKKVSLYFEGSDQKCATIEYTENKTRTVEDILHSFVAGSKKYHCLMYKSVVLFPGDTLEKIQSQPLFLNEHISLYILKNSARLYFYRIVLNQYSNGRISDFNPEMRVANKHTSKAAYIKEVIDIYSKYYYYQMNQHLRTNDFDQPEMLQMAAELVNACSLLPRSTPTQVFRGVSNAFKNKLKAKQIVQFGEFISTSKARSEAEMYTLRKHGGTVFSFISTTGRQLGNNYEKAGKEVIMHMPFTLFLVQTSIFQGKYYQTELVQIPGPMTYCQNILIWICKRPNDYRKELQGWRRNQDVDIILIQSVEFFKDVWMPVYGWLLKWNELKVRILYFKNRQNIFKSTIQRLSRMLSGEQSVSQLTKLLSYMRVTCKDKTEILFLSDGTTEVDREKYNPVFITNDIAEVEEFAAFMEMKEDNEEQIQ